MNSRQMKWIVTHPADYVRFATTGRVPQMIRAEGPLIDLLRSISPRDRLQIVGVTVDASLGYSGSRRFANAEQALQWCAPRTEMLEKESWPAESWRIKSFTRRLGIEELAKKAARCPDGLVQRYARSAR